MDYTAIVTAIISGVLGIGAVAAFMAKYMPAVAKWAMVAKDATETLSDLADALKDGALTADEIAKLKADVIAFQAAIK
jgi:hypothetical protein